MNDTDSIPAEANQSRLGLALSGGGFRASFFHLGVLARMAELDLLRQVEILSTVSGGSVIGAMYYLKVRELLQENPDNQITRQDYIDIVSDLEQRFSKGVKRNLRTRTFASPCKNLRMYRRDYSRSDRIAELYTRYLFAPLADCELLPDIPLSKTVIEPADGGTANDKRCNKVPDLLINATTLNTGHNFRFTSTWMGEVPTRGSRKNIDHNTSLGPVCYSEQRLPEKYRDLPLGIAVAASTAVPGLFHPVALTDLYEEWTPQLVDGGVHDNQGIEGLLDSECTHLIVSDACGQMNDEQNPSTRMISVLRRSNSVMMDRVREEIFETARLSASAEGKELAFVHLRQGLEQPQLTWSNRTQGAANGRNDGGTTACGVDRKVQDLLSRVRTDLDSFSEVEAQALMADGYLIATCQLESSLARELDPRCPADSQDTRATWCFLRVKPYLEDSNRDCLFHRQLKVAGSIAFKVFKRFRWLGYSAAGVGVLLAATLLCHMIAVDPDSTVGFACALCDRINISQALCTTLLALLLSLVLWLLLRYWRSDAKPEGLLHRLALAAGATIVATPLAWLHLLVFDRLFLWQGRVARLKNSSPGSVDCG